MNDNKKNLGLNNGWILCPSKSFPGKFYYFNVLNGEAAWSLNEVDKKGLRKDSTIHKIADKSHDYPEPTTLPDETSIKACNVGTNIKLPDYHKNISLNQPLSMFGQPVFNKYVGNVDPLMPNIVWTPVQMPMPMFCQQSQKPMSDKVTQTSEFDRNLFIQTCKVPLYKRFRNYEKPLLSFDEKNKIVNKPVNIFQTSTPKNYFFESKLESQNGIQKSKSWIKEPVLKLPNMEPKLPSTKMPELKENTGKSPLSPANKVESTMTVKDSKLSQSDETLDKLDRTDLRFLLLARRRKSVDAMVDTAVERKKSKPSEVNHITPKKRVTFNLGNQSEEDTSTDDQNIQEDFITLTPNHTKITIDTPKSQRQEIAIEKSQSPCTYNTFMETPRDFPTLKKKALLSTDAKNDVWYIVADTDVLLLDLEYIDRLVLSDKKCKLLIPNAVRMDIEGLCIGDCRGQQRVINARQLTRRLATPPKHYKVQPIPGDEDNIAVTSQSILNCCIQAINENYHVVLITNDPHIQSIANSLNIPSYKLNEIKNGIVIKPQVTSEQKKYRFRNPIDDTEKSSPFLQNDNGSSFGLFSDINDTYPIDSVKKQLFTNSDIESDNVDCDKLINITKPKSMRNDDGNNKCDSDTTTSDIKVEVKKLKLKDKTVLRTKNENKNPFVQQCQNINRKINDGGSIHVEKKIQNSNTAFNGFNFVKSIPKPKTDVNLENLILTQLNQDNYNFQNDSSNNIDCTEKLFRSTPNTKQSQFRKSNFENMSKRNPLENSRISKTPNMSIVLRQDTDGTSRETRILNPTQHRIKKMFSSVDCQQEKSNDATGLFKVPQPVQIKNRTKNTSAYDERARTDQIRRSLIKNKNSMDEIVKSFRVKSKIMSEKISSRIDEWICSFMQIMEDVLNNLLQKNAECMKNTVAPITLYDTLNCVKMLYDSHTPIREIVDKLEELLNKCVCTKGKLKTSLRPDDFMTMFGYGVILVLSLQNLLPSSEDLKEAESCLSSVLHTIENTSTDLDPDLFKTMVVSRSDVDSEVEEKRPNFLKEPSYVMDYLKKHFKEWASYKGDTEVHNSIQKTQYHPEFTVVRTNGKNLNLLKINSSKTISITKKTLEEDGAIQNKEKPKIIKLVDNDQQKNPNKNTYVNKDTIEKKEAGTKFKKHIHNDQNINLINNHSVNKKNDTKNFINENEIIIDQEKDVSKLTKQIENIDQDASNKLIDNLDGPTHGNTFTQIDETAGPKMIRNIKLIDEYEMKIQNREPLDLDLLDYSKIYEPSVTENLQFDVLSEKDNKNTNENLDIKCIYDDYGLSNKICTLEDFTKDVNLQNDNDFYAMSSNDYESNNDNYTYQTLKKNTENNINIDNIKNIKENGHIQNNCNENNTDSVTKSNIEENTVKTRSMSKEEAYNKNLSQNDSCIDIDNSFTHNENSEIHNKTSEFHNDNSEDHNHNFEFLNDDSRLHNDNSEINDAVSRQIPDHNFDKTAQIVRDDSTNDSGFENDSTYAHSVVKILLMDLSTSFIVIYQFVKTFIDEMRGKQLCDMRKNMLHSQASKSLEDMVAIIDRLRSIIKRESAQETVLKTLLLKAGMEATTNKRMTRYRQILIKSLEQAQILENALRIIVSTTIGDFDAISTNAESLNSSIRYFNIFE